MITKARVMRRQHVKKASKQRDSTKTLLFRLRAADSPNGVSANTLKQLAAVLGVPETQVIHHALRKLANEFIPAYEADDGPVSDRMLEALKTCVPQGRYKSVSSSLF